MDTAVKDHLLGQIAQLAAKARETIDKAASEGRDPSPDEQGQLDGWFGRIEEYQTQVKAMENREAMLARLEDIGAVASSVKTEDDEGELVVSAKSLGHAFVQSKSYSALMDEWKRTGETPHFDNVVVEMKAPGDPILTTDGTNADALAPNWDPTLRTPGNVQYPLRLAGLMNIVPSDTGGKTISYPVVTTRTAPSGNPTAEGAAKKGVNFAFDVAEATLVKNTAFSGVSDEMFTDAPRLVAWINEQMGLMVLQDEETQIADVLYDAAATNGAPVTGAGIGGTNGFDALREAIALIVTAGGVPQGILAHPNDAAYLDVLKATGGDEQYYSGGPMRSPLDSVWGRLPVVESTAAVEGAPLVGAFRSGASLYRRGGLRVESSNSHEDYFERDLVALRAYLRSIAAVHYPEWFIVAASGQAS